MGPGDWGGQWGDAAWDPPLHQPAHRCDPAGSRAGVIMPWHGRASIACRRISPSEELKLIPREWIPREWISRVFSTLGQPVPNPAASPGCCNSRSPFICTHAACLPSPLALPQHSQKPVCQPRASPTGSTALLGSTRHAGSPCAPPAAPTLSSIPTMGQRCQPYSSPCPTHPLIPPGRLIVQQGLAWCLDGHRLVPAAPVPAFRAMPVPPIPGRQKEGVGWVHLGGSAHWGQGIPPQAGTDPSPVLAGAAGMPGLVGISRVL